jgi:hypothetical protein
MQVQPGRSGRPGSYTRKDEPFASLEAVGTLPGLGERAAFDFLAFRSMWITIKRDCDRE